MLSQMNAVGVSTVKIVGQAGPINYPDGLAYSPSTKRVFVSDEHGGGDAVVDAQTNKLITSIRWAAAQATPRTMPDRVTFWWQCSSAWDQ